MFKCAFRRMLPGKEGRCWWKMKVGGLSVGGRPICDSMKWWGNVAVGTTVEVSTSNVDPFESPYVNAIPTPDVLQTI